MLTKRSVASGDENDKNPDSRKKRNFALFSQSLVKDTFSADTYAAITSSGFCMPAVTKEYFQNKKTLQPEVTNLLSKKRLQKPDA